MKIDGKLYKKGSIFDKSISYGAFYQSLFIFLVSIDLQVEKERVIIVDKNVKVGYPKVLDGKIRLQSTGGAVYIKALEPFPTTRLQLKDVLTNEIILLDISAKETVANPKETIRLIYENKLENQPGSFTQADENEGEAQETPTTPQLPIPAALCNINDKYDKT